jgi:NADH-quinone oxidoreductase subunit E
MDEIMDILARYPEVHKRSAVMPLLYLAQQEYGWLSQDAMREVAMIVGLDPTEVYGVAGFYSLYFKEPVGKYVIHICDDLPCALRGAEKFVDHACQKLGVKVGETTGDGLFTLQTAMCLAACDRAPMMQVNLEYYESLKPEDFDRIIEELRAKAAQKEAG